MFFEPHARLAQERLFMCHQARCSARQRTIRSLKRQRHRLLRHMAAPSWKGKDSAQSLCVKAWMLRLSGRGQSWAMAAWEFSRFSSSGYEMGTMCRYWDRERIDISL